ncbi:bifunctional 2-keto-4-hydroxyglutarate aldolase/2-keto-3-deoxy-6-phosphogluconate aldolase [uncultured Cetobacterium sp.]|uniref:bifunctional 2-keto-4-hydroxyglutarate aldolase/2-keto-3-deoxy-6-phosphogluconate aldolase n=1 Tax=uncultured Cetobacterium sp. TaxID=527638 RepID=UPI00262C407F|nr:bifunctional 2-keto-4-hydroxyglutarate aldolase/2-keto-3-deoxy-6-phosphogluconate aldolase [uncultured Cetobacterium sp.]
MLKKHKIIDSILETGVVAVVRAENLEEAKRISNACIAGGVNAIEVTYTVPGATEVISELSKEFPGDDFIIGAGTVLDSETARLAILAGAKYIVSPGFDEETAKLCNRYAVPYMPGCMTITEMIRAMELGCDIIKLFPGSAFGPDFIKAVKAPLPHANIMPTGGVSLENVDKWIKNGVSAVGVGGKLATGPSSEITETAKAFVAKIKKVREEI